MNVGQKDNTHLEVRVEMITSVCMNLSMFFFLQYRVSRAARFIILMSLATDRISTQVALSWRFVVIRRIPTDNFKSDHSRETKPQVGCQSEYSFKDRHRTTATVILVKVACCPAAICSMPRTTHQNNLENCSDVMVVISVNLWPCCSNYNLERY